MKVKVLEMKHFKRFRLKRLDFADPETGLAKNLIVLLGRNGSGKSTVLQAISATLGTAVSRIVKPEELSWPGFDLHLAGSAWSLPLEVTLDVEFSTDETVATKEYFEQVPGLPGRSDVVPPSQDSSVRLMLQEGKVHAAGSARQYFQFKGRDYAKQIVKLVPKGHDVFRRVGSVFWYTEQRTTTSLTPESDNGPVGVSDDRLRRTLANLMQFHQRVQRGEQPLRPGQRVLFRDLEEAYRKVFPERRFEGAVPRTDVDQVFEEPWFYLYDGHRQYEISEMSGGERAIFPMLFDFAIWNIHNSVILIDEIELHLHPPMQQALIRALRGLGENNQFIISTHSDWIESVVPPESIIRLED